ncbi:peroxisomal membrane anchor protein [Aspergillus sclerotialis]|uniref:Peroxisomal membrane protein PEX14 n=1 Tax=Aspergillus sclerotialis TaxID=2070753 RepID=A0A3A2ZQW2_9EURO|nr:peroxisomal membrane anchor protein [Aspergillus sclerotialis]
MSDSKKNPSIPLWQQRQNDATSDQTTSNPSPTSDAQSTSSERSTLLEQASKFLEDESIRDASTDCKISFLESKGLRNDEIQTLLGVSRNTEASSNTPVEDGKTSPQASDDSNMKASEETSSSPPPSDQTPQKPQTPASSTRAQSPSSPPPSSSTKSAPSRDVPPIITYPEFLFQERKKPPLVTVQGILYTLYAAAGLGAGIYGASEYLVKPMISNLTSARHELAETASENLKKLNEKLEQNVSTIPPHPSSGAAADTDEDSESITSDPTELFHRDAATQTTPEAPEASLSASSAKPTPDPTETVSSHIQRLETIRSHLSEFAESESKSSDADDSVRMRLNEMRHYLDGLQYSRSSYNSNFGMYTTMDTGSGTATGVGRGEEDAISNFKSEIRGVKGALLSARNFPSSRGGRISGGVPLGR